MKRNDRWKESRKFKSNSEAREKDRQKEYP